MQQNKPLGFNQTVIDILHHNNGLEAQAPLNYRHLRPNTEEQIIAFKFSGKKKKVVAKQLGAQTYKQISMPGLSFIAFNRSCFQANDFQDSVQKWAGLSNSSEVAPLLSVRQEYRAW